MTLNQHQKDTFFDFIVTLDGGSDGGCHGLEKVFSISDLPKGLNVLIVELDIDLFFVEMLNARGDEDLLEDSGHLGKSSVDGLEHPSDGHTVSWLDLIDKVLHDHHFH